MTKTKKTVLWIPIDEDCNVVFGDIRVAEGLEEVQKTEIPISTSKPTEIDVLKNVGLIKKTFNPTFCFWTYQDGTLVYK